MDATHEVTQLEDVKLVRIDAETAVYGVSQALVLSGHYTLQVLRGTANVGGVPILASDQEYPVSCPIPPYFVIKAQYALSRVDLVPQQISTELGGYQCVVRVRNRSEFGNWAALAPPFKSVLTGSVSWIKDPSKQDLYHVPPSWRTLCSHLDSGDRAMLVGPKNSGKSSLARYLGNNKVVAGLPVYYLELDPGQGEFCPQGTLSLHRLGAPSFGPPYTHADFRYVVKAHSLGYPSPAENPGRYLDVCRDLIDAWTKAISTEDRPVLLVINTPGWTKGLGLELDVELVLMGNPTCVCYMGEDESLVEMREAIKSAGSDIMISSVEPCDPGNSKFSASELRALQTLSYFHDGNSKHLTEWAPYQVPFDSACTDGSAVSAVAVLDSDGIVPEDYVICIEGTLVAIVVLDNSVQIDHTKDKLPYISTTGAGDLFRNSHCVGYAIVQSVSPTNDWIRLLTPARTEYFDSAVVLLRGRLQPPLWELWDQKGMEVPWITAKTLAGTGAVYTKFRRNIVRR